MKRVGVAELKNQLSKYLRAAEIGDEVEVTDHNRPIARIVAASVSHDVPIRPARTPFRALRRRSYPSAGWPPDSTELLLQERQGR